MSGPTLAVDVVTGATMTSNAIIEAVTDCLTQAGADIEALKNAPSASESVDKVEADFPADIIIVGGGQTGMETAILAADLGANVYLFEQTSRLGGSLLVATGLTSGTGSQMQKDLGIEDSSENFFNDIMRISIDAGGEGIIDPAFARIWAEGSGEIVDWLDQEIGVDYGDRTANKGPYVPFNADRVFSTKDMGVKLAAAVENYSGNGKIAIFYDTPIKDIMMDAEAVVGVIDQDGNEYKAPSIVLATGGYAGNEEWLKRYNFTNVGMMGPKTSSGDGFTFAEKAGAVFKNMDVISPLLGGVPFDGSYISVTADVASYPGVIWTDKSGNRFTDEFKASSAERAMAAKTLPENITYIILTEDMLVEGRPILQKDKDNEKFFALAENEQCVFKADTIEELAQKTGMDPAVLQNTISAYDAVANGNAKDEFNREEGLEAFGDGPFYAIYTVPVVLGTFGGPDMNEKTQTLNANGEPIPGLFQCGEIAGKAKLTGPTSMAGSNLTGLSVFAKITAENAYAYSQGELE